MAADAAAPDIAAQIAAIRQAIEQWEDIAETDRLIKGQNLLADSLSRITSLRAVLRTLEAAQAWAKDVGSHGLRQQLRQGAATTAIELVRAVRGETP